MQGRRGACRASLLPTNGLGFRVEGLGFRVEGPLNSLWLPPGAGEASYKGPARGGAELKPGFL